jgi:hypothetical protein
MGRLNMFYVLSITSIGLLLYVQHKVDKWVCNKLGIPNKRCARKYYKENASNASRPDSVSTTN